MAVLVRQVSPVMLQRSIFHIILPVCLIINTATASGTPVGQNGGRGQDERMDSTVAAGGVHKPERNQVTIRAHAGFAIPGFELRNHKFADRSIHYLRDQVFSVGGSVHYRGVGLGARAGVSDAKKPARRVTSDFEVQAGYFHRAVRRRSILPSERPVLHYEKPLWIGIAVEQGGRRRPHQDRRRWREPLYIYEGPAVPE